MLLSVPQPGFSILITKPFISMAVAHADLAQIAFLEIGSREIHSPGNIDFAAISQAIHIGLNARW